MGVPRYSLALSAGAALGPSRGPTLPPRLYPRTMKRQGVKGGEGRASEEGEREK